MIKENLKVINEAIEKDAESSPFCQDVKLIAVSKTKPADAVLEAYDAGIRDFGENKVQELCDKYVLLPKDIRWHLIGHLQTNKVKYIVDKVYLIHSVDTLHLAEEIEKHAAKINKDVNILIQVNVSGEESKSGVAPSDLKDLVTAVSQLPHLRIKGLMTIAPETEDPENCRVFFSGLRNLSVDIDGLKLDNVSMDFLSMGMSGDYHVAISEGSNMVRIGTSIFGKRNYNI